MKVALFLMDTADSVRMARPLIEVLRRAGAEVVLVHYWTMEFFPVDDLIDLDIEYLTISDAALNAIPRLAESQYRSLCGDDIDLLRCQSHTIIADGYPATRDRLFLDSAYHQRFRGFAYRIECLLGAIAPDVVVAQQGSEPVSKLVYAKSVKLGIPVLIQETSFFPVRILLDPYGMHFFPGQNRIDRMWAEVRERELTAAERARLQSYLAAWREGGTSKYVQAESADEVTALERFAAERKNILFVPDQVHHDANVLNGLAVFSSLAEMLELTPRLVPEDWGVVKKIHPKNPNAAEEKLGEVAPNLFVAREVSIHRLFDLAQSVLVFSSNVGLEALILDKPVITGGRPHYGGKGLTLDLRSREELPVAVATSPSFEIEPELRDRFLHHILFEYLLDPGDPEAVLARLAEASPAAIGEEERRAPFTGHVPARCERYLELARRYDELARENHDHREIVERIGSEMGTGDRFPIHVVEQPGMELVSGERQVATSLVLVAPDHLLRYGFARELARPAERVLDFACGTGYGTSVLAAGPAAWITGVDCSAAAITFARQHWSAANIEYVQASAGSYAFPEAAFDLVVALEIVEHVANDRALVDRLWRTVKPGGRLVFSVPDLARYPIANHPFHVRHYSERSVSRLLAGLAGLGFTCLLGQEGAARIDRGAAGKHLVAVAEKTGAGGSASGESTAARLEAILPFTRLPDEHVRRPGVIHYPADQFRSEGGVVADGMIWSDLRRTNCHVVYGPYTRLPAGDYTVSFLLGLQGEETGEEDGVILEVGTAKGQIYQRGALAARHVGGLRGDVQRITIPFKHRGGDDEVEFRVFVRSYPFRGRLEFHGAEVRETNKV